MSCSGSVRLLRITRCSASIAASSPAGAGGSVAGAGASGTSTGAAASATAAGAGSGTVSTGGWISTTGASTTSRTGAVSGSTTTGSAAEAAAAAFFVGRRAGLGSSGWTSRLRPSRSALRRTRSAWASSMLEEWLFTPIPKETARSSASLFVRPSSLASS